LLSFCRDYAQNIGKPVVMPETIGFNDSYSDPTLNDSTAASHISIVAGHFYGSGNYVHTNAINRNKRVWMTEHYIDNTQSDMGNCITIAKEISDAMANRFNAYFWWWVADYDSSVNLVDGNGNIFLNGYTIGQFAKWIRPGSIRVNADYNPSSNVYVTAYRVNGGAVIVAVNTGTSSVSQQFNLQNGNAATFKGYRTSSSQRMSDIGGFSVSSGNFTASLPGQSVTTFVQTSSGGAYKLLARHSGKAMEAGGYGTYNGTQIQQWSYVGGANQQWMITDTGNGYCKVIGVQSGKSLDIDYSSGGTANGTKVQLWDYWNGASQQFRFIPTDSGYYRISPNCATSSCLDVSGISTNNGALVHLWAYSGGRNQQWLVQPVDGTVKLVAWHSGKVLDANGAQTANGTQLQQWTYGGGANQKWTVTDTGSGNYKIIGSQSGRAVDIYRSGTTNGTKVQLWDYNGGSSQLYKFSSTNIGCFRITPNCATGSCLDVSGVSTADGAKVQLWQSGTGNNQKWSVQAP
jgi:hypothetical protein